MQVARSDDIVVVIRLLVRLSAVLLISPSKYGRNTYVMINSVNTDLTL